MIETTGQIAARGASVSTVYPSFICIIQAPTLLLDYHVGDYFQISILSFQSSSVIANIINIIS